MSGGGKQVTSPVSLVVSAFAALPDVRRPLTPQLPDGSLLYLVDLGAGRDRLGGSILAVILLVIGKQVALPSILPHIGGGSDVHALPFQLNVLALLGAGILLGAAGSGLTLRRFLQV